MNDKFNFKLSIDHALLHHFRKGKDVLAEILSEEMMALVNEMADRLEKKIVVSNAEITNEISFRAYSRKFDKMIYPNDSGYSINVLSGTVWQDGRDDECAVMLQYTNVKDRTLCKVYDQDRIDIQDTASNVTDYNLIDCLVHMVNGAWGFTTVESFEFIPFCTLDFERYKIAVTGNEYE